MQEEILSHAADLIDAQQGATPEQIQGCLSDSNELELMRVAALAGRTLAAELPETQQMADADWKRFAEQHPSLSSTDKSLPPYVNTLNKETQTPLANKKFNERQSYVPSRKDFWLGALLGAAASLVCCLVAGWMWWQNETVSSGLIAYRTVPTVQEVTLETAGGSSIELTTTLDSQTLSQVSTSLQSGDSLLLAYNSQSYGLQEQEEIIEQHSLTTPHGKDFTLQLPDGSTVMLNGDSRIEYPSRFTGQKRIVRLQGEAYFEVAKDTEHPFIVETEHLCTRVLGTQFDVRAYDESAPQVVLIEGKVEVTANANPDHPVILASGQSALLDNEGQLQLAEVDIDQYTYWRNGYFYYDDQPIVNILQEMGRWYNVNIVFENEELMQTRMHYFCDRNDKLEEAIRILNYQPMFHIRLSNNTLYVH